MTDLLAIGTRKGLWLARSDDDRRTWTLDGPHLLAQEVAAVSIDTRRPSAAGAGRHPVRPLGARPSCGPTTSAAPGRRPTTARSASPRTPGRRSPASGSCAPTPPTGPDVVWAGCEPHSLWRSTDGGSTFELVRGLHDHPHRPTWQPGGGGGAVHTVLPDPASDRVTIAMSTGGVYVSEDGGEKWEPRNRGITVDFLPDPLPEYGQCVHKVAVDAGDPDRLYAQNHFGVFRSDDAGGSWSSIADGLPADFGFPIVASPRTPGHGVGDAAGRRHAAGAAGRPAARAPHPRRRGDVDRAGRGPARRRLDARSCATRSAPTTATRPGIYVGTRDGCVYASADEGDTFTAGRRPPARRAHRPRREAAVSDDVQVLLPGVLADLAGGDKHVDVEPAGRHARRRARRAGRRAPDAGPAHPRRDRARCAGS